MMKKKIYILIFPMVILTSLFLSQVSKSASEKVAFWFKSPALREKQKIERKELRDTRLKERDELRKKHREERDSEQKIKNEERSKKLQERKETREKLKKEKTEAREKHLKERKEAREKRKQERKELRDKKKKGKEEAKQERLKKRQEKIQKETIEKKTEGEQEDYKKTATSQIKEREEQVKKIKKLKKHIVIVSNPEDPLIIEEAHVTKSKTDFMRIKDVELGYKLKLKNQTPKIINDVLLIWERKIPFNDTLTIAREVKVSEPIIPYEERNIQYNDLDTKREGEIYRVKVHKIVFEDGSLWQNPVMFHHHY